MGGLRHRAKHLVYNPSLYAQRHSASEVQNMAVERIGVAIQGAGNVSTEHLRAYINNPHTEVVAIGSRTLGGRCAET